jgi:hypothetical protein
MSESTALTTTGGSVFSGIQAFEDAQRIAKALASSTLIPPQFQGQQGFANCLVALEIANRLNLSPFLVMQHVHVIHGRPSFSSQFLIALVNGCGEFSPLRFELRGEGEQQGCRCTATDLKSGELLEGPWVSVGMAKKEGWATKSGSKWQTMPELMLRYRAAAFWQRLFASHLTLGFKTEEEVLDVEPVTVRPAEPAPKSAVEQLNAKIKQPAAEPVEVVEASDADEIF